MRFDILTREIFIERSYCKFILCHSLFGLLVEFWVIFRGLWPGKWNLLWRCKDTTRFCFVVAWKNMLSSLSISTPVSWHIPCLFHVHFRAENFEPYLSQVLKIRWEDELGKKNPLADKEYRYFIIILFCHFLFYLAVLLGHCWFVKAHVAYKAVLFLAVKYD